MSENRFIPTKENPIVPAPDSSQATKRFFGDSEHRRLYDAKQAKRRQVLGGVK